PALAFTLLMLASPDGGAKSQGRSPAERPTQTPTPTKTPTPTQTPTQADSEDIPTVSARVDREQASVGDVINVVVTAVAKKGVAVNLPSQPDLGKFTVLEKSDDGMPRDLGDGHLRREFSLRVAAYEPGEVQIPAIEVTYLTGGGEVRSVQTQPI